uniref:Ig-like domain-containing protein n=1 Tax=Echeneis naucrates TaxID=173247 RepID=A0A665U525_ECHNA
NYRLLSCFAIIILRQLRLAKPFVILTQDPDYKVMFPGESVSFSCHINVSSGWEYVWHKGGSVLGISENKYLVNSVGKGNSGLYTCKAKRGTTQVFFTDSSQVNLEVKGKFLLSPQKYICSMHALKFNVFIFHLCQARFLFYFSALCLQRKSHTYKTKRGQTDIG